ncbi:MAG: hypothetical protein A3K19_09325 [Lentisphaerae bacterium RIFOXYB12_FULL_65_16]|nr:MAG: hypothetical protein A3K18_24495 [Lentisphaerae bacterium RIFOXYA12_64_32]OGV90451.1 MAG: hypothetical protein A3K19_09325 [Lentisphaerae bacterium RIFOXYB12_FULL_65_16]
MADGQLLRRRKWQYHVITALKKAVKGTAHEKEQYQAELEAKFGDHAPRCPKCGSKRMRLIRVWSAKAGTIYEAPGVAPPRQEREPNADAVLRPIPVECRLPAEERVPSVQSYRGTPCPKAMESRTRARGTAWPVRVRDRERVRPANEPRTRVTPAPGENVGGHAGKKQRRRT